MLYVTSQRAFAIVNRGRRMVDRQRNSLSTTAANNNSSLTVGAIDNDRVIFEEEEMPGGLREPFIKSGYRRAYSTPWQCLKSLFYINNESVNVWSHIIAALYFAVRYGTAASTQVDSILDPFNLPLLASAMGTVILYSSSATAHLFNSISERGYKICFFFDYAAVSFYTFTSCQAMFFYARPVNSQWRIFESPAFYLSLAALFSFLVTYGCCKTDAAVNKFSTFLRMLSVIAAWIHSTLPILVGATLCTCHVTDKSCWSSSACSSLPVRYYLRHAFYTFLAGFMYSTRLPERLIPGRFDLVGNSHHFLHVCVAIGTEYAFKMVEFEINARKARGMLEETTAYVSILNTLVAAILVMFLNACIAFWFSITLKQKESSHKN
ncbi:hypothetical protein pdam_00005948 [Pocillopora damicornis]|uniref:Uncharacterized protein n=2 Tax=Pocillopora damicornis TaxID=46731 RepID=A0A3M6TDF0_POCDA|nr:hypothetical protein pdam_00005948 [Pocillopora damicornis]